MGYDFLHLSPPEFEDLTRDILQAHLGVYLESFADGPDEGIDLRNSEIGIIVQCKRYKEYGKMLSELRKEINKVKRLQPKRYILTTTVSMTSKRKREIRSLFENYIISNQDIIGKEDLNNLLGLYPEIEKKHYKLWFAGSKILESIIHSNIHNRSLLTKEQVEKEVRFYVQNNSFDEALEKISNKNFIIISGLPGTGKTTLAKMLLYYHMVQGYELIDISYNAEDFFRTFSPNKKQIFLFDDFLGRNFLKDRIERKGEQKLISIIKAVRDVRNKKLIMTTREYILQQAKIEFEELNRSDFKIGEYLLNLDRENYSVKAKILYNHLFFSGVSKENIDEILDGKKYMSIITHRNYCPRLIEDMTLREELYNSVDEFGYYERFMQILNNPGEIWDHVFQNQITKVSKYILLIVCISGGTIEIDDLRETLEGVLQKEKETYTIYYGRETLLHSLKELENTFIRISINQELQMVSFQNPSINDYISRHIEIDQSLSDLLIRNAKFFDQLYGVWNTNSKLSSLFGKISLPDNAIAILGETIINNYFSLKNLKHKELVSHIRKLLAIGKSFDLSIHKNVGQWLFDQFHKIDVGVIARSWDRSSYIRILMLLSRKFPVDIQKIANEFLEVTYDEDDLMELVDLKVVIEEISPTVYRDFSRGIERIADRIIENKIINADDLDEDSLRQVIEVIIEIEGKFDLYFDSHKKTLDDKIEEIWYGSCDLYDEIEYDYEVDGKSYEVSQPQKIKEKSENGIHKSQVDDIVNMFMGLKNK